MAANLQTVPRCAYQLARVVLVLALLCLLHGGCASQEPKVLIAGVSQQVINEPGPVVSHVVRADLSQPRVQLAVSVGEGVWGTDSPEELAKAVDIGEGELIAAINGDYFEFKAEPRYHGTLQGTCIVDGELVSTPGFPTFWMAADGRMHLDDVRSTVRVTWPDGVQSPCAINASTSDYKSEVRAAGVVLYTPRFADSTHSRSAREFVLEPATADTAWLPLRPGSRVLARVRAVETAGDTPIGKGTMVLSVAASADSDVPAVRVGDVLTIDVGSAPDLSHATAAVAGSPRLLKDGQVVAGLDDVHRHPRTAVGFAGRTVVLVVVDGRREGWSIGMTHAELARLMQRLGCTDAVNLDGGGSSSMWYRGRTSNEPSDGEPRNVSNAIVLWAKPID